MDPTYTTDTAAAPLPYTGATVAFPTGLVQWSDAGALLIWLVLVAFIGSLLGVLRETTAGRAATRAWSLSRSRRLPNGKVEDAA
jgi:hypothetical protein